MASEEQTGKAGRQVMPGRDAARQELEQQPAEAIQAVKRAADGLLRLVQADQVLLAQQLSNLLHAAAEEAGNNPAFAAALSKALSVRAAAGTRTKRPHRRAAGPFDPFAVMNEAGEIGLRAKLGELDLGQLRDIVAEHGMDHDRLALRWKDPGRLIDRIVEKVNGRNSKGSAFRS
jgi:hypothetical protein